MSDAIITEIEKLGSEAKEVFEKFLTKLKSLLPSEHHAAVDEAAYIAKPVDETTNPPLPVQTTNVDTTTSPVNASGVVSTTDTSETK